MDAAGLDDAPLVVITGGLGRVATVLLPWLRRRYRLRLVDRTVATARNDEVFQADIGDPKAAYQMFAGADAILHLAANSSPRQTWDTVYAANVRTTQIVLEAAATHAVPKVVLASSLHAMGEYNRPRYWPVDPRLDPRPCCAYGLGKVVLESMGRLHADRTGASVTCLRLGLTGWPLTERRYLGQWLSDGDAGRLVLAALQTDERYGVHFGVSANTRNHWDTTSARHELGYRPEDDSEELADRAGPSSGPVCRLFDTETTSGTSD
ncbi:NAD-dependent epimerase/dehydratase family protein [Kribbella sp. CA-294648]|uniref:NAD-dependent epimerase/dehydratase family protein n=1 Tax=Kribbella sp. CA-294648 TaxID=3239948 RepID=UPI003D8A7A3C